MSNDETGQPVTYNPMSGGPEESAKLEDERADRSVPLPTDYIEGNEHNNYHSGPRTYNPSQVVNAH